MTWHALRKSLWICALALVLGSTSAYAADHAEAPGTQADPAADINDFYMWHTEGGNLVAIVTFPTNTDGEVNATDSTLFTVHIDNDADNASDIDIHVRFGQNSYGEWGYQVLNLPSSSAPVGDAVGVMAEDGSAKAWVGVTDDPFFFDATGFGETLTSGELMFDSSNDDFAGANVSAIVLEFPASDALATDSTELQAWATTGRQQQ